MTRLELEDIQGILIRGYGSLPAAYFLVLRISNGEVARRQLAKLLPNVTDGTRVNDRKQAVHVAFTFTGLKKLGLDDRALAEFPIEFRQGMAARKEILGDIGAGDPEHWSWGGQQDDVDALLLLYAAPSGKQDRRELNEIRASRRPPGALPTHAGPDVTSGEERDSRRTVALAARAADAREQLHRRIAGIMEDSGGFEILEALPTNTLVGGKEHFGFRDGIAQPLLDAEGLGRKVSGANTVSVGEFVLGYANESGAYSPSPKIPGYMDPGGVLPIEADGSRDFGRNGSYLVFRQLSQDVKGFWEFVDREARYDPGERDRLAAKMVGRWRSGSPLTVSPHRDDQQPTDDFGYVEEDPYGQRCPIASHVRRSNPRDSIRPGPQDPQRPDATDSLRFTKRHRLLRRGRAYGDPVAASLDPQDILDAPADDADRGTHFICLNASITHQFEFVLQTWVNNPKFAWLDEEADPLLGNREPLSECRTDSFVAESDKTPTRVRNLPRFVTPVGGSYFFLPGLRALGYLVGSSSRHPAERLEEVPTHPGSDERRTSDPPEDPPLMVFDMGSVKRKEIDDLKRGRGVLANEVRLASRRYWARAREEGTRIVPIAVVYRE